MTRAISISASNIYNSRKESTSYKLCEIIKKVLLQSGGECEILDLREFDLSPCIGCGKCFESKRCYKDQDFNIIYNKLIKSDCISFVSPHYAPIPAKLSMLLEKMGEITFLHWMKEMHINRKCTINPRVLFLMAAAQIGRCQAIRQW